MEEKIKVQRNGENMPELRGMTRQQAREFNEKGLNPFRDKTVLKVKKNTDDTSVEDALCVVTLNDAMNNWILDNVYPEYDFDNADQGETDILAAKTYRKTFFPGDAEIKNF
jgi:hypothetical protein